MAIYAGLLFARQAPLIALSRAGHSTRGCIGPAIPRLGHVLGDHPPYFRLDEFERVTPAQVYCRLRGRRGLHHLVLFRFAKDAFHLPELSIEYAWPVLAVCWKTSPQASTRSTSRLRMA